MPTSLKISVGAIPVTVSTQREALEPLVDIIGAVPLCELSAPTVRSALKELREHLQRQGDARLRAGVLWQDNGLVFTTALGTHLDAADVLRSLRAIWRKADLGEEWTPRQLRHTSVSLLSDNGMAIEESSHRQAG